MSNQPWTSEPDYEEWEEGAFKCVIRRSPSVGVLCGYVGVPDSNPAFKQDYDDLYDIDVHGDLTYSEDHPPNGEPDGLWWLGFDCGHAGDLVPISIPAETRAMTDILAMTLGSPRIGTRHGTYRDISYVRDQVKSLAKQLAEMKP